MAKSLSVIHKQRTNTSSNWSTANPVLAVGQIGIESDTRKLKVGDGATTWNSLHYAAFETVLSTTNPAAQNSGYAVGTVWINTNTSRAYVCLNGATNAVWVLITPANDFTDTYKGYIDFLTGYTSATTLANLSVSKRLVFVTLNSASTLSLNGTLSDGRDMLIIVYNSSTSSVSLTLPTTGSYESKKNDGTNVSSVSVPAGGKVEISIVALNSKYYIKTNA